MSRPTVSPDAALLDLCHREWRRRPNERRSEQPQPTLDNVSERICPLHTILPPLVQLLRENPDRPMSECRESIRRMIEERDFIDECGDPCIDPAHEQLVRDYVDMLVRVLERVRRHHLAHHVGARTPMTPLMFG